MKILFSALCALLLFQLFSCSSRSLSDDNTCQKIDSLNVLARRQLNIQPDSAFAYANRALQINEMNCLINIAESHEIIGEVFLSQGIYQQSLSELLKAMEVYKNLKLESEIAQNLNYQGLVYFSIKQPDRALDHYNEALALYTKLNDESGMAFSYGCVGRVYEKRNDYTTALSFQQKALHMYERAGDNSGMATILENIGSIYEDKENYETALQYFKQSLRLAEVVHDSLLMIVDINNIGDNFRKTARYAEAVEWTQKSVELSSRLNARYELSSGYKDLSKIYGLAGDYRKAYDNLEVGRNIYEEMYAKDASRQSVLFETLFDIERKNHDIINLENSEKVNNLIKITLATLLFLIGTLGAVVINRQRSKIRSSKEASARNNEVFQAKNKLLQAEVENSNLNKQKLRQELETKAKSLATHTLHIIGKNKILEDLQEKLSALLKEGPGDNRKQIKALVKMIEHNFVQDKDWVDFRQIFEQVHQDFFDKLQTRTKELTPSEIRLAALIRLNMPSKDIATVLGISQDSLRISRYRLRKKLEIQQGENLTHFIVSL